MEGAAVAQRADEAMKRLLESSPRGVSAGAGDHSPAATRGDRWIAVAVGLGSFVVYAAGACPTIYVGDSGELVTAVHVLGVPHPTGYPLYVLLGKLWTLVLPLGSVAYRMSLFSAACAAVACAFAFLAARGLGCGRVAALFAALLLAFSPSFWGEANVQRVYALNAAFVTGATCAALAWWRSRSRRALLWTVFLCALGAANHTFMALYGVAFAGLLLFAAPAAILRPATLAAVLAAGTIGLLPYAYLPIASSFDPPLDWGNPETWSGFVDVVLRRDFWGRAWIESPVDVVTIAADYLAGMAREVAWVGVLPLAIGLWAARRDGFGVFLMAVMAINLLAMAAHGSRSDLFIWHRYYIPSYAIAALCAGIGIETAGRRLGRALPVAALALPVALLIGGWDRFDRSDYRIAEEFSRHLLATIPPGATLAATDDNILFVLIYLTMVEGVRPDVDLILQGVADAAPERRRFDPATEPLYFTHHPNWNHPELDVVPVGLAFRVWRRGQPLPELPSPPDELAARTGVEHDYLTRNLVGHYYFMLGFTAEREDWRRATSLLERAMREAPDNDVLFYNVGLIYERNGDVAAALAAFRRSHEINPRPIAGASRARASDKIEALEARLRSAR